MLFRSNDTATTEIYTLSLHDALPIFVVLTAAVSDDDVLEAIRLGIRGLVLKESAPRALVECVRRVHAGGQYEWDSAAPVAVALAAGFHASRLDGSPLRYNQENTYVPDLVICRPELASDVLSALRECSARPNE